MAASAMSYFGLASAACFHITYVAELPFPNDDYRCFYLRRILLMQF